MKTKRIFALVLLFASLTWMGCPSEELNADYAISLPQGMDSVAVEWVFVGNTERGRRFFESPSQTSNNTWGNALIFASNIELDMDNPDALRPSMVFDSLFVYWTVQGEPQLVHAGVDDADWVSTNDVENYYRYLLSL